MRLSLDLAQKGEGQTSPNPLVGAVIVRNGKIVAQGYHHAAGKPHAEIEALKKIKFRAKGATLYLNLEPCCHYGRTPPCVPKIIESGLSRVVMAHRDPNPLVSGRSVRLLKKSGISVSEGVCKKEALFLNRFFVTRHKKKRPYIILKVALSQDGKIAYSTTSPVRKNNLHKRSIPWITGSLARLKVHQIRSRVDSILVGVGTVLSDNPLLNVRAIRGGRQPLRIVLDTHLRTPLCSNIFKTEGGEVILATCEKSPRMIKKYEKAGAHVLCLPKTSKGRISLKPLLLKLADREITSILVEGGGEVFSSFVKEGFVDEMILFVAPKKIGNEGLDCFAGLTGVLKKMKFRLESVAPCGRDIEYHLLSGDGS